MFEDACQGSGEVAQEASSCFVSFSENKLSSWFRKRFARKAARAPEGDSDRPVRPEDSVGDRAPGRGVRRYRMIFFFS